MTAYVGAQVFHGPTDTLFGIIEHELSAGYAELRYTYLDPSEPTSRGCTPDEVPIRCSAIARRLRLLGGNVAPGPTRRRRRRRARSWTR